MQAEEKQERLYFGMDDYVQSINHALNVHLSRERAEEPLTIGVFGAWGSGKTRVLKAVESEFEQRLKTEDFSQGHTPTIPVWFNPWRFEAEEHLIIPLLKTTEQTLRKHAELHTPISDTLKSKVAGIADAAIALGAGIKGKFSVGGVGFDYDIGKMLTESQKRKNNHKPKKFWSFFGKKRIEESLETSKDYQSIYFDINRHLSQITKPDQAESDQTKSENINLVYFIDDLDRCLPDKAVQVLESIKLFLDIPGCAFVLGMDEEVVDRGIAYRYRKYLKQDGEDRCPITGHEYLEKIIHLPFHLPSLNAQQVHAFLLSRYPDLFAERLSDPNMVQKKYYTQEEEQERKSYQEHKADLLDFFINAVPYAPRKLIRACELLSMNLDVIQRRSWKHEQQTTFVLTLARLVLLQLFAPDLYRFGKQKMVTFLSRMEKWAEDDDWGSEAHLESKLEQDEKKYPSNTILERQFRPLVKTWIAARNNRSGFDPDKLIVSNAPPCDTNISRYFLLLDKTASDKAGVAASIKSTYDIKSELAGDAVQGEVQPESPEPYGEASAPVSRSPVNITPPDLDARGVPDDPQLFLDSLFSGDALQMQGGLEQEKERLQGQALASDFFQQLLKRAENQPDIVDVGWVQALEPYVSYRQLAQLYEHTGLLEHLAEEVNEHASE